MATVINSKPEREKEQLQSRFSPTVKRKRMTNPRRRLNCGQGRDFFRMCAAFAHPDTKEIELSEKVKTISMESLPDLAYSKYLQARYQERSAMFVAKRKSTNAHERSFGLSLTQEKVLKTHVKHMSLAPKMNALEFHLKLKDLMDEKSPQPFLLVARSHSEEIRFLVETARLFWSHRLQIKSLQASNAAEPSIRYFHAALRSSLGPEQRCDFLYWLKMDEEKMPQGGDFIEIAPAAVFPLKLCFP